MYQSALIKCDKCKEKFVGNFQFANHVCKPILKEDFAENKEPENDIEKLAKMIENLEVESEKIDKDLEKGEMIKLNKEMNDTVQ